MDSISTLIRFHDIEHISLLERAIASLHSQSFLSVQPIVILQDFTIEEQKLVNNLLREIWYFEVHKSFVIVNVDNPEKKDLRSKLINTGIKFHYENKNRFLTFLDYDDILYSNAFNILSKPLIESDCAISFASVDVAEALAFGNYDFIYNLSSPYKGSNKIDLMKDNFCPIHSYMIDTNKVDKADIYFNEEFTRVEDYEFLLRVAGKNPCNFSSLGKVIGLYFMRNNGINTTPSIFDDDSENQKLESWKNNSKLLDKAKSNTEVKFYASDF